ncbi:hypothetical protein LCGC14_1485090 [marine sediment metagenome]|uniref:Uncharacterized protein n=1 Tax=marine sediment metagenome TaxID=412755 RepID=A0A0F9MA95_9ZZZZ
MSDKELTDEDLERELDKAFKENEKLRDNCGTPIPSNKEVGVQRTNVKIKSENNDKIENISIS